MHDKFNSMFRCRLLVKPTKIPSSVFSGAFSHSIVRYHDEKHEIRFVGGCDVRMGKNREKYTRKFAGIRICDAVGLFRRKIDGFNLHLT